MSNIKVNSFPTRKQYTYAGGAKVFVLDFPFFEDADIFVYVSDPANNLTQEDPTNLLTITTDYTVTGAGLATGGTVTIDASVTLTVGFTVTVVGRMVIDRTSILDTNSAITREQYNEDMNRLTMMIQDLNTIVVQTMPKYDRSEFIEDSRANNAYSQVNFPALGAGEIWYGVLTSGDYGLSKAAIGDWDALGLLDVDYVIGTDNPLLPNAQPLGGLGTGYLFNTDDGTTGTLSVIDPEDVSPEIVTITQAGHGFAVKNWIYRDLTNVYIKAQADNEITAESIGMVIEINVGGDADVFKMQQSGINDNQTGLTDGKVYYLDPAVLGGMTDVRPTNPGHYTKPVYYATSATTGWILSHRSLPVTTTDDPVTEIIDQVAHGFVVGDEVRRDGTAGDYALAQSDNAANAEAIGMVVAITANTFTLQEIGYVADLTGFTWGPLVDGDVYFLSPTTAGKGDPVDPTGMGEVSKPIFLADGVSSGWILHYRGAQITATGGGGGGELVTWVYFDASSGTPTIQAQENVASLTDNGVGDFDVNFTTAFANTLYTIMGSAGGSGTSYGEDIYIHAKDIAFTHIKAGTAGGGIDMSFNHYMARGLLA